MTPIVVGGATTVTPGSGEGLILDGLSLSDTSPFRVQGFDCPPPAKRTEWVQGADIDGSLLVRDPLFENRQIAVRLRISQQSTMDSALDYIEDLSAKLEEAEVTPDGLPLVWSPAGSTKSLTFYVLSGEIDGMPIILSGDDAGWFLRAPVINLKLVCKPFGYGDPVTLSPATSSSPLLTFAVGGVTGDAPAEGRLIVTDGATQSRRHIEWGLEQRYYNASTSLLLQTTSLTTSGFSASSTTRSGSYSTNVFRSTVYSQATAMCGTGVQSHVGTFRVKARVYAVSVNAMLRLSWQEGDGPYRANPYVSPAVANDWSEVDLGLITIPPKQLGTQKWSGRIEALTTGLFDDATGAGSANLGSGVSTTVDVDCLELIPAGEGYGIARGAYTYSPGVIVGRDNFASLTLGAAVNGRTALQGGNWATSGATTDFTGSDTPSPGDTKIKRGTSSDSGPRFAQLGTSSYTDTEAAVSLMFDANANAYGGIVARYVDASNYLQAVAVQGAGSGASGISSLVLRKTIAGTTTVIDSTTMGVAASTFYRLSLIVFASGKVSLALINDHGQTIASINASDSALGGGGTLASGKVGVIDANPTATAVARYYDDFTLATPAAEPIALYSGRQAEVRFDGAIRQDSTGTYWGSVPSYRGSRMLVPPAGDKNRTSRIAVKARRNDIETSADNAIADSLTASLIYTPRFIAVPT